MVVYLISRILQTKQFKSGSDLHLTQQGVNQPAKVFSPCISLLVVFMASLRLITSDHQAVNIIKCKYCLPMFKVEALYHGYTLAYGSLHCPMGQDIQIQLEITPLYFPQVNQKVNRINTSSISTEKFSMGMSIRKNPKMNTVIST